MPADFVIRTGDMIQIMIPPPCVIPTIVAPVPLTGTGATVMINNMPICLEGDELPPMLLSPQPYFSPPYVTPGTGTLSVTLMPTNKTIQTKNGKAILIKGSVFTAKFQVMAPAMMPTPGGPVPDPLMVKMGTAQFITTNVTVKAG